MAMRLAVILSLIIGLALAKDCKKEIASSQEKVASLEKEMAALRKEHDSTKSELSKAKKEIEAAKADERESATGLSACQAKLKNAHKATDAAMEKARQSEDLFTVDRLTTFVQSAAAFKINAAKKAYQRVVPEGARRTVESSIDNARDQASDSWGRFKQFQTVMYAKHVEPHANKVSEIVMPHVNTVSNLYKTHIARHVEEAFNAVSDNLVVIRTNVKHGVDRAMEANANVFKAAFPQHANKVPSTTENRLIFVVAIIVGLFLYIHLLMFLIRVALGASKISLSVVLFSIKTAFATFFYFISCGCCRKRNPVADKKKKMGFNKPTGNGPIGSAKNKSRSRKD